jgi:fucose 4-O-acetylase-like acetyltransferase
MPVLTAPLWFLTGLFSTLVIYKIIMRLAKGNKNNEWIYLGIIILIGILLKYFCPILLPWSIDTAFISVGFIHFGKILKRENIINQFSKNIGVVLMIVAIFIVTSYIDGSGSVNINMSIREFGHSIILYLVVGTTGSLCVMFVSKVIEDHVKGLNNILELIGRHTIGILAFHLIIFGIVGTLLGLFGSSTEIIKKVAQIIIAVVILVPIDWFIQRYLPFVYGVTRRNK